MLAVLRIKRVAQPVAHEIEGKQHRDEEEQRIGQHQRVPKVICPAPRAMSVPSEVKGSCTPSPRNEMKLSVIDHARDQKRGIKR